MAKIINKVNRRILIGLKSGKNIELLAGCSLEIADDDASSPHLKAFVEGGEVAVVQDWQSTPIQKADAVRSGAQKRSQPAEEITVEKKVFPETPKKQAKKRKR
jgi:hypothetical protein